MDKLKMQSMDKIQANIDAILKIFPDVATEAKDAQGGAKITNKIDFAKLKQHLVNYIVDDSQERYQFTWPDKRKAILTANTPINKTLRPNRSESVDFDTTQNLYIEGDNLEVLKLLQYTYLNKVKMIYIDPPYNTGEDFIYEDDFSIDKEEYLQMNDTYDYEGNRLVKNTETNGRFHTDWLNMMYPRLMLAKDLLSEDGVIFISIDDHEDNNLKTICNEVFGEQNYVQEIIWEKKFAPQNDAKYFSLNHEKIICYAKVKENFKRNLLPMTAEQIERYKNLDNDSRGPWQSDNLTVATYNEKYDFPITKPNGAIVNPPNGRCWRTSKEKFYELLKDNRIWFGADGNGVPRIKRFLSEIKQGKVPISIFYHSEVGHTQEASKDLKLLFDDKKIFSYPKPVKLLHRLTYIATNKNDIILDFFSGSATTAHAVMQLNAEDGGNRKFIMVQIPEKTDKKSEAFKAGYKNICEIGKERIRRAGAKIRKDIEDSIVAAQSSLDKLKQEQVKKASLFDDDEFKQKMAGFEQTIDSQGERLKTLDTGFRVFKVDSSNMNDVYYTPDKIDPLMLDNLLDNIKSDRSPEDLLFQVMLDLGIYLSSEIKVDIIAGKKVFNVEDNYLIACFDQNVTCDVVEAIAKKHPQYAVFRDSSFADDNVATNIKQIFKLYAPDTTLKTL